MSSTASRCSHGIPAAHWNESRRHPMDMSKTHPTNAGLVLDNGASDALDASCAWSREPPAAFAIHISAPALACPI